MNSNIPFQSIIRRGSLLRTQLQNETEPSLHHLAARNSDVDDLNATILERMNGGLY